MSRPETIDTYLRAYSPELGQRIIEQFPPLHAPHDALSPRIRDLLRRPYPAQNTVLMGIVKAWRDGTDNSVILGEMGTGKTLISLGALHVHSEGSPYTALAMVPPHLVNKWAREALKTIPRVRVFLIDGMRDDTSKSPNGIHEVRLRRDDIVRDGLATTVSDLRLRKTHRTAHDRWLSRVNQSSIFIVGRETAKLGPYWRHAYNIAKSGEHRDRVVNPDTGLPVLTADGERLTREDFDDFKRSEIWQSCGSQPCRQRHSALWQVDPDRVRRIALVDFIGRYMPNFFDYVICDEVHQLANESAQGNALGVLASCAKRLLGLTGTLVDGYAGHLFNILFRLVPHAMRERGYEWGVAGRQAFVEEYGLLEEIEITPPRDNASSDSRTTVRTRERPGASPRLFGDLLMPHCGFIFLEDIAAHLPDYSESIIGVQMDEPLERAYKALEIDAKAAIQENRRNRSVISKLMHTLLLYPNHPFGIPELRGRRWDPEQRRQVEFVITRPASLPQDVLYPKERDLIADIRQELATGRRCQVFAVYTKTQERLKDVLELAGFKVALLTSKVPPARREAWYTQKVKEGVQVVLAHPKLVETGLDLLDFPTIYFYETGHSLHVLRQASRRSYRIGQKLPVRVKFLCYQDTSQDICLSLMARKLMVALTTEGQFSGEGLQEFESAEDDMLSALARELVNKDGIGETAEQAWRALRDTQEALRVGSADVDPDILEDDDEGVDNNQLPAGELVSVLETGDSEAAAGQRLILGQKPDSFIRKRSARTPSGQGSLFDGI